MRKANLKKYYIAIAAICALMGGYLLYYLSDQMSDFDIKQADVPNNVVLYERKLDGVMIEDESETNLLPVAVMIENHFQSRPPSALSQAKIVYEIIVEGEITRFLAIYDLSETAEQIGPIRSARPYYIDIAEEYGAVYVHSGGSPDALDILRYRKPVYDFNEFFRENYFWRDRAKLAPHNLYTSGDLLREAKEDYDLPVNGEFTPWSFKDMQNPATSTPSNLKIDFSDDITYQVEWRYDKKTNSYVRWQSGEEHIDDDGSYVTAKNVIVQVSKTRVVDNIGRRSMDLDSGGEAIVYIDGKSTIGEWQKIDGRTVFFDESGNEIEFNRGSVWVEVVSSMDWVKGIHFTNI